MLSDVTKISKRSRRMSHFLKVLSGISTRAIYLIYVILALILLFTYLTGFKNDYYLYLFVGLILLCIVGTFILVKGSSFLEKRNEKRVVFGLLFVCFIVKFIWIYSFRIQPYGDYRTFYDSAVALSDSFQIHSRYIALFPHIFGYSTFLSIFLKIFGTSYMIAPILNVCLSTISMGLIFFISKNIGGLKTAITSSILWIVFPSQTIFNMFVLSEPLYSTILLLIWAFTIAINKKLQSINIKKILFYSVVLALLFALMNMSRPIAAIPLIALAVWLFIVDTQHLDNKKIFIKKAVHIVTVILCYFIFTSAINQFISVRVGEKVATAPGYNMYVGFNMKSYGQWNEEDSVLLYSYSDKPGWTADQVQKQMLTDAKKRVESGKINFLNLFFHKLLIFLGNDSAAAVMYGGSVLGHVGRYTIISNVYYYFLIVASLLEVGASFLNRNKSYVFFICLYPIGLTLAQMLVEVAGRYHYSATIAIVIMAACGISRISKKGFSNIGMNKLYCGSESK
jgi:hypothetical protein